MAEMTGKQKALVSEKILQRMVPFLRLIFKSLTRRNPIIEGVLFSFLPEQEMDLIIMLKTAH